MPFLRVHSFSFFFFSFFFSGSFFLQSLGRHLSQRNYSFGKPTSPQGFYVAQLTWRPFRPEQCNRKWGGGINYKNKNWFFKGVGKQTRVRCQLWCVNWDATPQNKIGSARVAPHAMNKPAWSPKVLIFLDNVAQLEQSQRRLLFIPCLHRVPVSTSSSQCLVVLSSGNSTGGSCFEPRSGLQADQCLEIHGSCPFQPDYF